MLSNRYRKSQGEAGPELGLQCHKYANVTARTNYTIRYQGAGRQNLCLRLMGVIQTTWEVPDGQYESRSRIGD